MLILQALIILNLSSINLSRLLQNTAAQPAPSAANEILKNATIVVPLKYLNNF